MPNNPDVHSMTVLINSIAINGFRALTDLRMDGLGRVNLITGKNNSGKSSLLEAIRVLATGAAPSTLSEILEYREELDSAKDAEQGYVPADIAPVCNLFTGFPSLGTRGRGFTIAASGSLAAQLSKVEVSIDWFVRKEDPTGQRFSYEPVPADALEQTEAFPALVLHIAGRRRVVLVDRMRRGYPSRVDADASAVPCVYLDPFSSRSTNDLGSLWDAIALTDAEQHIVKALQVISADIQAVSVIGSGQGRYRSRTAIAKSTGYASRVPLRTFGDGVNRLFGVFLSLCNARNGVLLVDEIENGLHYSIQSDIWRAIFRLASDLDAQVFATTHSWDCVHAFQEAASESPQEGALVRLTRQEDRIMPTLFTETDLEVVTRDLIEVR